MLKFWRKKRRPYTWAATHDANKYTIIKDDNWFASILLNGEMLEIKQVQHMINMVEALNKNHKD